MLGEQRRKQIERLLLKNKSVMVKDLCERFDVTSETIRKDLIRMEQDNKLIKTHGGAFIREGVINQIPVEILQEVFTDAKQAIGTACSNLIQDGDTILLDSSTTSLHIARLLGNKENLTVITNSMKIAQTLAPYKNTKLLVAGGCFEPISQSFLGRSTEAFIERYHVDKCFVSCRGLSIESGITDASEESGIVRRAMLAQSKMRVLVLDATKCDITSFFEIDSTCQSIHRIVIDYLPTMKWNNFFEENNIAYSEALPPKERNEIQNDQ